MAKSRGVAIKSRRIVKKKAINSGKDSYLLKTAPNDMAVCKSCGAVYHGKRWSLGKKIAPALKKPVPVLCPACQKIRDNFAEGFVTLKGGFLSAHRDEILALVRNKEAHAMYHNPLDRVISVKSGKNTVDITTTTEKLAERIGQMIKKAYSGNVEYKWSADTKLARIVWTRDA